MKLKKIKSKKSQKNKQLIIKIIVGLIILMFLGLILVAALGNLDAIRTLWKTP